MKIDEPKTPYAKQYDPTEDEEEISQLNAEELVVDELDAVKLKRSTKEDEIPSFDLGEPEMSAPLEHSQTPDSERRVVVDIDMTDDGMHGEEPPNMTAEEREKHHHFEMMRRKHYEMRNVKNLLGYIQSPFNYQHDKELIQCRHPDDVDEDEEDETPAVPHAPATAHANGA
jgi:protein phosphatase inhibitor 2